MPRGRNLEISVINITMHPHSSNKYIQLFELAGKERIAVKYRGEEQLMLHPSIEPFAGKSRMEGVYGWFYRGIDVRKTTWLDVDTFEEIKPEDGPEIPPQLRAKSKSTLFVFFPKQHKLFFVSRDRNTSFNPAYTAKALENIFKRLKNKKLFDNIFTTVVTKKETIKTILRIPRLTKIEISITLPNGDVPDDDMEEIKEKMERMGIRKKRTIFQGKKLTLDSTTIAEMKLATYQGHVHAEGYGKQGEKKIEKTENHPVILRKKIFSGEKLLSVLVSIARDVISRL